MTSESPSKRPHLRVVTDEALPAGPETATRRSTRWSLVFLGTSLGAALLGLTGYVIFRQMKEKEFHESLRRAKAAMKPDTKEGYLRARAQLERLASRFRKQDPELEYRLALTDVMLWGRFSGSKALLKEAENLTEHLAHRRPTDERVAVLRGLILLLQGRYGRSAAIAESGLARFPRSGWLAYLLAEARLGLGDLEAAQATFRLALSFAPRLIPARYGLALVQRLRGHLEAALALLDQVLRDSPNHTGAQVEKAVVQVLAGGDLSNGRLEVLKERAKESPADTAKVWYLAGLLEMRKKHYKEAARRFLKAAALEPSRPEYLLALLNTRLNEDAAAAIGTVLPDWKNIRQYPGAAEILARTALAAGRPKQALSVLEEAPQPEAEVAVRENLRAQALLQLGQWNDLAAWCRRALGSGAKVASVEPGLDACALGASMERDMSLLENLAARDAHRYASLPSCANRRPVVCVEGIGAVDPERRGLLWDVLLRNLSGAGRESVGAASRWYASSGGAALPTVALMEQVEGRRFLRGWARIRKQLGTTSPWLLFRVGRSALAKGERHVFRQVLSRLKSGGPESRPYLTWLLGLEAARHHPAKAVRLLGEAARRLGWRVTVDEAQAALASGDTLGAWSLFSEAFAASAHDPKVLERAVTAALSHGQIRQARRWGLRAVARYRKLGARRQASRLQAELAFALLGRRDVSKAFLRHMFRRAVSGRDVHPRAYYLYGEYLRRRGRWKQAVFWLGKALAADPSNLDANFSLLELLVERHRDLDRAKRLARAFLDRARTGRRARQVRRWLARIKRLRRNRP